MKKRQEVIKSKGLQEEIGAILKEERKKKGLTLEQLSLMSGLSRLQIMNIENGSNFTIESLYRLAQAMQLRLNIDLL